MTSFIVVDVVRRGALLFDAAAEVVEELLHLVDGICIRLLAVAVLQHEQRKEPFVFRSTGVCSVPGPAAKLAEKAGWPLGVTAGKIPL